MSSVAQFALQKTREAHVSSGVTNGSGLARTSASQVAQKADGIGAVQQFFQGLSLAMGQLLGRLPPLRVGPRSPAQGRSRAAARLGPSGIDRLPRSPLCRQVVKR